MRKSAGRLNYPPSRCPARGGRLSASNVCPNCGAANGPANLFCTNCGTRLAAAPPTETRVYPAAPSYPVPPSYPVAPAYPTVPPSMPPVAVPYPYVPGPSPWRVRFSTILSSMFKVWSENFLTFFVVFLVLALVNNLIAALLAYARSAAIRLFTSARTRKTTKKVRKFSDHTLNIEDRIVEKRTRHRAGPGTYGYGTATGGIDGGTVGYAGATG